MNRQEDPPIVVAQIQTAQSPNLSGIPVAIAYPEPQSRTWNGQLFTARGTTPYALPVIGIQQGVVNGQLFTSRGTTPYAQPVIGIQQGVVDGQLFTSRSTTPYAQPVVVVPSNNSIPHNGTNENVLEIPLRPKPPIRLFGSALGSNIIRRRRVYAGSDEIAARNAAEAPNCCARACVLITCVLCIVLPFISMVAAFRKSTADAITTQSGCLKSAPSIYARDTFVFYSPLSQGKSRWVMLEGNAASLRLPLIRPQLYIEFWYYNYCSNNCFLYLGTSANPAAACSPIQNNYKNNFAVLQLNVTHTGCYQIRASIAQGSTSSSSSSNCKTLSSRRSSGSVVAAVWIAGS